MSANQAGPRSISLLDDEEFARRGTSDGRVERVVNGDVTLSAEPDGAGGTRWDARAADGRPLRLFQLSIEPAMAAGPVVVDTTEGVYVCYEDAAALQSWCVKVKSHY